MDFSVKEVKRAQIGLLNEKIKEHDVSGEWLYNDCKKKIFDELTADDTGKKFCFEKNEKNELIAKYLKLRFDFDGFKSEVKELKNEIVVSVKWI